MTRADLTEREAAHVDQMLIELGAAGIPAELAETMTLASIGKFRANAARRAWLDANEPQILDLEPVASEP